MVSKRLICFFWFAALVGSVVPATAQYKTDCLMNAVVSPDAKSVACTFKATACADVLDPHATSTEHQVVAVFNLETKRWKIVEQIERTNPKNDGLTNQYLGMIGFSANGKYFAATNTKPERTFIQRLAGMPFAIPSHQTTVTLWDVKTKRPINSLKNVDSPDFLSSTGCILNVPTMQSLGMMHLTAFEEKIDLWDLITGKRELSLEPVVLDLAKDGGEQYDNAPFAFSPDGKLLAASIYHLPVIPPGHTQGPAPAHEVRIYDTQSGKPIKTLPIHATRLAFSEDGKTLVSCETGVEAWDLTSGKNLWKQNVGATGTSGREAISVAGNRVLTYTERLQKMRMSNGSPGLLHNGTHDTQVFDLATGKLIRDFGIDSDYSEEVTLTPDGKNMLHFSDKRAGPTITIYEIQTGKLLNTIKCPMDEIEAILDRRT
jgi:WD40 repeat protein